MTAPFFRRVLVLSPHTDDGELAAGGTIASLVEAGSHIPYLAFSAPRPELRDECARCLDVADHIILDFPRRHFPNSVKSCSSTFTITTRSTRLTLF